MTVKDDQYSLTNDDKKVLLAIAVVTAGDSVRLSTIKQLLKALGWKKSGLRAALSSSLDGSWQARMVNRSVLELDQRGGLCIDPQYGEVLLRVLDPDDYTHILKAFESVGGNRGLGSYEAMIKHAYHKWDSVKLFRLLQLSPYSYIWNRRLADQLSLSVSVFDDKWFLSLPLSMRWQLLGYVFSQSLVGLDDIRPYLPVMAHCAGHASEGRAAFQAIYSVSQVLVGQSVDIESLDVASSSWLSCAAGFCSFAEGRAAAAVGYFESALKLRRKELGERNASLDYPYGIFYPLALLQVGDKKSLGQIRAMQQAGDSHSHMPERKLIAEAASHLELINTELVKFEGAGQSAIGELIVASYCRWFAQALSADRIESLESLRQTAREHGLAWYAAQADSVLSEAPLPQESVSVSIATLLKPVAHWEMSLKALINVVDPMVGKDSGSGGRAKESRMAWFIEEDFELEPREQKRNKNGTWTKGRKVSLKRLQTERHLFEFLTPADERLCDCISLDYDRRYYGYEKETYFLSESALLAAVGHPAIYWPDELREPVEVRELSPELVVLQQHEQLHILLTPTVHDLTENIVVERRGFNQLEVTRLSAQHLEIARILGPDGLHAPSSAREQVLQSISAIAPLLTVQSDIGGGADQSAELVESDPRLHIQIQPAGEGLRFGVFARPFGEQGPLFTPGVGGQNVISEIDGKRLRCERDIGQEQQSLSTLVGSAEILQLDPGSDWTFDEPEHALEVLDALRAYPDPLVLSWPQGRSLSLLGSHSTASMSFSVSSQREWFGLDGEIALDENNVMSLQKVLQLVRQSKGRFLHLGESEFFALSESLHKKLKHLSDLTDDSGRFHPLASASVGELTEGMLAKSSRGWKLQQKKLREANDLKLELPSTLGAQLRDYQLSGYDWMMRLAHWGGGACLADDMGLGKTIQILAVLLARAEGGPAFVLAPTSVCMNWLNEAARFAPTLRMHRFGDGERSAIIENLGPRDVVVSSYGLMQSEIKLLAPVAWHTLVADEAQALKNPRTLRSKAAISLSADFRIIATGTPIENHLGELWSLFQVINPGLLGGQKKFEEQFVGPIERGDMHAKQRLKSLVAPFILRRHKSQVLTELPSRTEIDRVIEASEEEKVFYEALRRQAVDQLAQPDPEGGNIRFKVLAEIMRLRRACCHPQLVAPEIAVAGSKLKELLIIVAELIDNGHKALIFSQFVDHLKLIRKALDEQRVHYQYLDGSTTVKNRQKAVDAFQAGQGDVFLISLKAGGSGLNLTAADYVIHMDPWWNPAVEDQASDRAHRMGQQRPVTIYRLIMAGTIEQKILSMHQQKRELADSLLEGREVAARVNIEDMMELLSDGD